MPALFYNGDKRQKKTYENISLLEIDIKGSSKNI